MQVCVQQMYNQLQPLFKCNINCINSTIHVWTAKSKIVWLHFSSPGQSPCEFLSWVSVRRPSVRPSVSFSHLTLLLWNRWTDFNQTYQKCSFDGSLPGLCFWCWFEIQNGCQGPWCFLIGWNFKNPLVRNHQANWIVTAGMSIGWSCTKLVNRLPMGNSRWPPWVDLVLT